MKSPSVPKPHPSLQTHILGISLNTIPHLESLPAAGRTWFCQGNWRIISSDAWIAQVVGGYRLELMTQPNQRRPPCPITMGKAESMAITSEIGKLSEKGAFQPCVGQFLSQLFLVPKKDGSQRPVINLKPLNLLIQKQKFKMEGAKVIRDLLQRGDWMTSIDLKDAYLSVPVAKEHRKYLRFAWGNTVFEFQCLPFGLSSAPRIFTKLLKPVMALLRKKGIRCIIFLDDLLIMGKVKKELESLSQEIILLLQLLGFRINFEKSHLTPTQTIKYLGFWIDSTKMIISLPEDKVRGIIQACQTAVLKQKLSVRDLARLLGRMSATAMAVLPAPICYRSLQRQRNAAFAVVRDTGPAEPGITGGTPVVDQATPTVEWTLYPLSPTGYHSRDGCLPAWMGGGSQRDQHRGVMVGRRTIPAYQPSGTDGRGLCNKDLFERETQHSCPPEDGQYSSYLVYQPHGRNEISESVTQGMRTMAMVPSTWDHPVGRASTRSNEHCSGHGISHSEVISRVETQSRSVQQDHASTRILLDRSVCIQTEQSAPQVHELAPRPIRSRHGRTTDALVERESYAFPPFALIGRCLRKIHQEGCSVILVAPVWVTQPWYPMLLELLVDLPLLLPAFPLLSTGPIPYWKKGNYN